MEASEVAWTIPPSTRMHGFSRGWWPCWSATTPRAIQIVPATDLAADLNVDSVAAMDLIMEIEDRFEIDIPINLVSDMTTVADLVALVERQLKAREAQ